MPSTAPTTDSDAQERAADTQEINTPTVAAVKSSWSSRLVLATIVVVATLVRIPGVLWGRPYGLNSDEPVITENAIDLIRRHSLSPRVYDRPDHLEIILSSFAYRTYAWIRGAAPIADFAAHPSRYLEISRSITGVFSVVAVVLAWYIGRRFNTATAVTAALLVAFFPPFVANSTFATPDMWLTCMMLGVILASMRYLERPTVVRLLIACACVGVGFTIKYPAVIGGVIVGVVVVMVMVRSRDWWRGVRHIVVAPLFAVIAVFAVSHVLITNFSEVLFQLSNQRGTNHLGAEALGFKGNIAFYAGDYASWAGIILLALSALGIWWCIRQRAVIAIPLVLGVVYWIGLSTVPAHWERWALPMFLAPLLFAAVGVGRVWVWVAAAWQSRNSRQRLGIVVTCALTGLSALQLFSGSAVVIAGFAAPDARVAMMPAFQARGINQETAIYDGYTPIIPGRGSSTISTNVKLVDGQLKFVGKPGARYIVTSSIMYDRYTAALYPKIWVVYQGVREQLPVVLAPKTIPLPKQSVWEVLAVPQALSYVDQLVGGGQSGPTITVYQIPPGAPLLGPRG